MPVLCRGPRIPWPRYPPPKRKGMPVTQPDPAGSSDTQLVVPDAQTAGETLPASPSGLVDSAPDGSWAFRNRFFIRSNNRFNFNTPTHALSAADSEEYVVLGATAPDTPIVKCESLVLWGSPYPSFDAAVSAGRKWRQIAMSVFPRLATGCDFGDDDDDMLRPFEFPPERLREEYGLGPGFRMFRDRLGLLVFPWCSEPVFGYLSVKGEGLSGLDDFPAMIAAAERRHNGVWPDEVRLAYDLVHAALGATRSPEARHIFTVTALEALIPFRQKHPELSGILDKLIDLVDQLDEYDDDLRNDVKKILEGDKQKSINQFGKELAGRLSGLYGGVPPPKFWTKAYGVRSGLAHGNPRGESLSRAALHQQFIDLLMFVLDILESWTENPGYESDQESDPDSSDRIGGNAKVER